MRPLKILKILGLHYDSCIRRFYRKNEYVKSYAYEDHLRFLESYAPVHLNSFRDRMRTLGMEAEVVVYDLETLQRTWAKENGFRFSPSQWRADILLEQITRSQPDVVFLQDIHSMPHFIRKRLRQLVPSIKKVVLFKGFPGALGELSDIDLVFAGIPNILHDYENENIPTQLLYHGFEDRVLDQLKPKDPKPHALSFIGYSGYGGQGIKHKERYYLLRTLAEATDMKFWITETEANSPFAHDDSAQPFARLYPERCFDPRFGIDMYQILCDSAIVFNRHTEAIKGYVGNMRMFETTGVGSCLLTDTATNMADLFEADSEVVTYSSAEECLEKLHYLLEHPEEREAIARKGQTRTLKDHSIARRCETIARRINELFD